MANYNPPNNIVGRQGPGRPVGSKNVATRELRETLNEIVQMAATKENILGALEQVRIKSPYKYLQLITRLIDLVLPRQQQIEVSNEEGIDINATIEDMRAKLEKEEGK